jgi:hypothetical protein
MDEPILTWHGRRLSDLADDELDQAIDALTADLPADDPMTAALRRLQKRRNERPPG